LTARVFYPTIIFLLNSMMVGILYPYIRYFANVTQIALGFVGCVQTLIYLFIDGSALFIWWSCSLAGVALLVVLIAQQFRFRKISAVLTKADLVKKQHIAAQQQHQQMMMNLMQNGQHPSQFPPDTIFAPSPEQLAQMQQFQQQHQEAQLAQNNNNINSPNLNPNAVSNSTDLATATEEVQVEGVPSTSPPPQTLSSSSSSSSSSFSPLQTVSVVSLPRSVTNNRLFSSSSSSDSIQSNTTKINPPEYTALVMHNLETSNEPGNSSLPSSTLIELQPVSSSSSSLPQV
jgi:hypothetical protein